MDILLKKSLFWDVQEVDLQKNDRFVIERILQFGDENDFSWAKKFYGTEKIKGEFIKSKVLDNKSCSFWCRYFNIDKAKCIQNQLTKKQTVFWKR